MTSTNDLTASLDVLVVEDNPDAAATTAMLLRTYGHRADTVATGPEAIERITADCPDAVILDIGLPGLSGFEVAQAVAAHRPQKTPLLIAVSGYATEEDQRRSKEAGIHVHLAKPADPEAIRAILARFAEVLNA